MLPASWNCLSSSISPVMERRRVAWAARRAWGAMAGAACQPPAPTAAAPGMACMHAGVLV